LPLVEDNGWFFDTELLLIAERNSLRIHEVPVDWVDDPDSRVDVVATALADLAGMWRVARRFAAGRSRIGRGGDVESHELTEFTADAGRFARVGIPATIAWVGLFLGLRASLGPVAANVVALSISALGNLAARRRFDRQADTPHSRELELVAVGSWTVAVAATTLAVMATVALSGGWLAETLAAMATGAVVSLGRFVVLRALVMRHSLSLAGRTDPQLSRGAGGDRT
jgi:putative flippase GtrA